MQCYGPEASAYTARRLFGQLVRLEDDVERHDVYGRRLAYVYLHGANFEEELLRKGYARLLVIEPNHAHAREMLDDELNARARRHWPLGSMRRGAVSLTLTYVFSRTAHTPTCASTRPAATALASAA